MKHVLEGMRHGKRVQKRALPITIASLSLGLIFDWFFYDKLPGVSVFIYTSLLLGILFGFAWQFKKPVNTSLYWLTPAILFFALMVAVRANGFLSFVNICLVTYLLLLTVELGRKPDMPLQKYRAYDYTSRVAELPMRIMREGYAFIARRLAIRSSAIPKASVTPVIRGIIFSLPILLIFLLLLSSADLVFKQYIGSLFNPDISPEIVFRLGLVGFVTSACIGAYTLVFIPSRKFENASRTTPKKFGLGTTESSIILGSVGLLFLTFVLIQLRYLFGGASQIGSAGYTYAEYARKGFFELIAVAAITLLLLLTIKKTTTLRTLQQTVLFKWLSGALILEVLIIVASAHLRLNLYEAAYGFTTLRLWSHLFILWQAVAFVLLGIYILWEQTEQRFVFQMFVSILCLFALINTINPDAFIVRENVKRFNNSGKLDVDYLGTLSQDATPAISQLLNHPDKATRKRIAGVLYQQKQIYKDQNMPWQSTNFARQRANQTFRDHAAQIEDSKGLAQ